MRVTRVEVVSSFFFIFFFFFFSFLFINVLCADAKSVNHIVGRLRVETTPNAFNPLVYDHYVRLTSLPAQNSFSSFLSEDF